MSAPAAKAFSEPVTRMQPMSASASKSSSAEVISSIRACDRAFMASGRLSVITPTPSFFSTRIFL